ncbi:PD-(D/E)XK nuclease family protein [bacterium]|nr:PD-(D/E)XK nuclease family protein [bacterium]
MAAVATVVEIKQNPLRASNLQRAWLCPPSVWRESEMPEMEAGAAAEEGRMLHAAVVRAWKRGDFTGLDDEQRGAVAGCVRFLNEKAEGALQDLIILEQTIPVLDSDSQPLVEREVTPDVVILRGGGLALVIDWKTGRGAPQFDAGHDLQLLTYAIAVRNHYTSAKITRVHVFRFHPRLWDENRETSVSYGGSDDDWHQREGILSEIILQSQPDANAVPGAAQCQYCKAKMICEEFRAWSEPDPSTLPAPVNTALTPAKLGQILQYRDRLKLLDKMMSDAEDMAKQAIGQGIEIVSPDGTRWGLKEGSPTRTISDLSRARAAMLPHIPSDAFDSACKVSITSLEKVFKTATRLKGKAAAEAFASTMDGAIEFRKSAPSLVAMKAGA